VLIREGSIEADELEPGSFAVLLSEGRGGRGRVRSEKKEERRETRRLDSRREFWRRSREKEREREREREKDVPGL